jgi:hypothetical protein
MMATPDKPQGKAPGTKNPGGLFVDPLDKWEDEDPPLKGGPTTSGSGSKDPTKHDKFRKQVRDVMVNDVDKAADKVEKLIKQLTKPGLSRVERAEVNKALVEARKSFLKLTQASNKISLELKDSRRFEAEAYAKLNRLRTMKANAGTAGLTQEQEKQLEQTEQMLKDFIKTANIFRQGDNHLNEDVRKEMQNKMDQLIDNIGDLPEYIHEMFDDEDKKIDLLLKRQQEAKDFVKGQNEALKKFMWKTADRMGIGAFNLGNLIRGGRAVYNLPKNIKAKYNAVSDKIGSARAYVAKTIEMRKLAKSPIVSDEELQSAADGGQTRDLGDKKPGDEKTAGMLERYAATTERFRRRLLEKFGKKKDKPKVEEDKGLIQGMLDFFGKGGFLKTLLGVAARVSAVAIAGAIGYWIGTKIWEKIAPWVGEKFNNLSGNDAAGKDATRAVVLNTRTNYDQAKDIETRLSQMGTANSVTPAEKDFLASYYKDNSAQAKDMSKYQSNKNLDKINERQSTGGFARADRASSATPVGAPSPAASSSEVTLPDNGAGAGRGSVNPDVVQPSSIIPVSTGGQISDSIGKSIQLASGANVEGLHPALQSNLANMANDYYLATGKKLQINSGFRSPEEQERLFKSMPPGMAASPGSSLHNFGLAIDVQSAQANELANLGLLEKYGFVRPIASEKWHMQPAGVTVAAAKSGVYSADSPAHQNGTQVATASPSSLSVASAEPRIPVSTSDGGVIQTGSGGTVGTMSTSSKKSASDIPTFDTTDGMLTGMNLGVIAS